jgi:hypothetical protein
MKRLISLLLALIALASFAGCIFALNWIWTVKKPLIDKTNRAFGRIDEVLALARTTIDDVQKNLEVSRASFRLTEASSARNRSPSFIESMMVRSVASQVSPNIADVQRTVNNVTEASIVVNSILESLQGLEGIERINTNPVRAMQSQMGRVTTASWELSGLLNSVTNETDGQKSARIIATLDQVIQLAEDYEKQVGALQHRVGQYEDETLYWLNLAPTLATVALGWVAISQVIVIATMMRIVRQKRELKT